MLFRFFLLLSILTGAAAPATAAQYAIDPAHGASTIRFEISRLGIPLVSGSFKEFLGLMAYDANRPDQTTVEIVIDTTSVETDQPLVGKAVRSKAFLDSETYPQASFRSTAVTPRGADQAVLTGEFTLRGITRPLAIKVERTGNGATFSGEGEIRLADYDIDLNVAKGMGLDLGPIDLGISVGTVDLSLTVNGMPMSAQADANKADASTP